MGSTEIGGLGEIPYGETAKFLSQYRFFFNPIRYTSLGLSVCEAMTVGLPIIGVATTEMVRIVQNDISGYIDTDIDALIAKMKLLIQDKSYGTRLSRGARKFAKKHFSTERFVSDWDAVFSKTR